MLVFYLAAIDSDESKNKFEYIYHKYYRFMLRTASSIIRDSSLAEDAVHETFVQLLKEIDSLRIDNEKSLQSYLYILTRERTIDFLRKWERRRGVLTDYENRSASFDNFKEPEEIALTNLQLNKAVSILSDMPSIYRRTLDAFSHVRAAPLELDAGVRYRLWLIILMRYRLLAASTVKRSIKASLKLPETG